MILIWESFKSDEILCFYFVLYIVEVMNIFIIGYMGWGYVLYRLFYLCIDVYNCDLVVV